MAHRTTLLVALILFLGACVAPKLPTASSQSFTGDESAVLEATFRHLFAHNHSGLQGKAKAYCLLLKGETLDRAFLSRFSDLPKPLRDRTNFRPGLDLIFQVTTITKIDSGLYRVEAGYYEGPVSGSSTVFDVGLKSGKWHVSKNPDALELISKRANKTPEPTTMAVTSRAPSSTSRASHGRGSS